MESHGDPIADFSDKRNLVGTADLVFLGKVNAFVGQSNGSKPISTFYVEVVSSIKGTLADKIVQVQQYGGYTNESGKKVFHIYEDDPLLQIQQMYVFSAIQQKDGSLLLIPGYGSELVTDGKENGKLTEYRNAFNAQIIPELKRRSHARIE